MISNVSFTLGDKFLGRIITCFLTTVLLSGCTGSGSNRTNGNETEVLQRTIALAVGYLRAGKYGDAKDTLTRALDIDPRNSLALTTLGVAYELEGEIGLAERNFKRAISVAPKDSQAHNNYAAFLFRQDQFGDAKKHWLIASEDTFFTLRPQVYANLGRVNKLLGEAAAAEEAYVRAVELNPSLPQALLPLANLRFDQRNYVEAKFYHERYESVAPQTPEALWLCVRVARIFSEKNKEASCSLALRNIFPATEEYRLLEESQS